ncbi:MAG: NAD(P)H-dependent oxidoreductase [Fusobacteria bacterium]|nr:NAD(P)H-dependent oxidoreductase [Fusobacteriota bacterium]
MSKKIIYIAHPNWENSRLNKALLKGIETLKNVTIVYLYDEYGNFQIDVKKEQSRLLAHDTIIFQTPFHWYSTTPLLRKWFDDVLTHGFAYGSQGKALEGKKVLFAITTGGPKDTYTPEGYNSTTVEELTKPLCQLAKLCGLIYLDAFVTYGALEISDSDLEAQRVCYQSKLMGI